MSDKLQNITRTSILFSLLLFSYFFLAPFNSAKALTVSPPRIDDLKTDPGKSLERTLKLTNSEKESQTFYTSIQNFEAKDETGSPNFVDDKKDLASWIKLDSSVTLGPNESKEVKFTIDVPANAEPGGYNSAIFFQTNPPETSPDVAIGLGTQVGSLVLLTVNGPFTDEAGIITFATKDKQFIYNHLPVEFFYRFQNTGDSQVKPLGDLIISNTLGYKTKTIIANPEKSNVLKNSIRKFELAWTEAGGPKIQSKDAELAVPTDKSFFSMAKFQWNNFAMGIYSAKLVLAYGTGSPKFSTADTRFIVFPWQLILVMIVVLLVVILGLKYGLKFYNKSVVSKGK